MQDLYPLESSWIVAAVSGVVAIILLLELARSLPAQNIILIMVVLLAAEGALGYYLIDLSRADVTGPIWNYIEGSALLWMAVVLAARRLAQTILRPWREEKVYGFWLLGMSGIGAALFQFGWPGLDPDQMDRIDMGVAAELAGIRFVTTVILLACLMPWFLRKSPAHSRHRRRHRSSKLAKQPQKEA